MASREPEQLANRGFEFDDGSGLRVAHVRFESEAKFDWSLFDGYDRIRILTYSAGVSAIIRLLEKHSFSEFECVFGCESTLRTLKDIMAFQQVAIGDTRAAIKNLSDERHAFVLSRVRAGQARFRVLRKQIAHAKLYLLENTETGSTRTLVGSANLSETAFGGRQSETLVCFDDDRAAWDHYLGMYEAIRDRASDELPLPPERIESTEIALQEVPVLDPEDLSTLVIDTPESEQGAAEGLTAQEGMKGGVFVEHRGAHRVNSTEQRRTRRDRPASSERGRGQRVRVSLRRARARRIRAQRRGRRWRA